MSGLNVILLAAGKGTRLKVEYSKILADLCGQKMIDYPIKTVGRFANTNSIDLHLGFVLGHQKEQIQDYISQGYTDLNCKFAYQEQQLGTAHAVQTYFEQVKGADKQEYSFILCGDTPCLLEDHFQNLWKELTSKNLDAVAAVFETNNPFGLGRIFFQIKVLK